MSPCSMTGFGRGDAGGNERVWTVEIRTVNHRFLDQRVSLPKGYGGLEDRIRKRVAKSLDRGRVEILAILNSRQGPDVFLELDRNLAEQYHRCLQELWVEFGLERTVRAVDMALFRNVIRQRDVAIDLEREWVLLAPALDAALDECGRMRRREGEALKNELLSRLHRFSDLVDKVRLQAPQIVATRHRELTERIGNLLGEIDLDPARLAQEAAIMADKVDITEEMVRLQSHITQFEHFLSLDEPVGRRLDFLLQEFLREVNTLASKISNASVAHLAVEMKNEVEKLREQVQNIE